MNLLRLAKRPLEIVREPLSEGLLMRYMRGSHVQETLRLGPNEVHGIIKHPDGTFTDLGVSHNLLTTVGRDLIAYAMGISTGVIARNTASGTTATSLTDSGESWTTDAYKGMTVFAEDTTSNLIFGNIGSNTGTVLTIDDWQTDDGTSATDPGSTPEYIIIPTCRPIYMGITADTAAASASNTTLTSEQTANGLSRVLCTGAHTGGQATFTLVGSWTATGTVADLHRIGLFTAANTTAAGVMVFESVLNTDASVTTDDTLQVTDTVTLS